MVHRVYSHYNEQHKYEMYRVMHNRTYISKVRKELSALQPKNEDKHSALKSKTSFCSRRGLCNK